jgi:hypothetical protein
VFSTKQNKAAVTLNSFRDIKNNFSFSVAVAKHTLLKFFLSFEKYSLNRKKGFWSEIISKFKKEIFIKIIILK